MALRKLRILHAEDDPRDAELICSSLEEQGIAPDIRRVETMESFMRALEEGTYDLIISDFTMPAFDGLRALRIAKEKSPGTPFIYVSGTIGEERAVEALRNGAIDYVLKDKLFKLGPAVEHALRESALRSQRHQAEEQFHEAHRQLQRVVAASPAIIYTKAPHADGTLVTTFVSENVEAILGYTPEQVLQSPRFWAERVHPSDRETFLTISRTTAETSLCTVVYRFRRADGEYRWLTDESRVVSGDGLESAELVGSVVDVSDQREMEARRWESEQKFRVLAEKSPSLILIWRESRVIYANEGCMAFLGIPTKEVLEAPFNWKDHIAEESMQAVESAVGKLAAGEEITAVSVTLQRRDHTQVSCVLAGTRILYESAPASLVIATDVSQLRTLEEEKRKLNEQLQHAQKMDAVGRLAGGIAHDFNNMLMVIQGYVGIVKSRTDGNDSVQRYLEEVRKAIDRAASLTHQLLVFSRKQVLQMEILSLRSIVEEAANMIRRVIGDDVELCLMFGDGFDSVKVDRGQMTQVLLNLAVNARDAMPKGGVITIETRTEAGPAGRGVLLEVRDTGIGMDKEVQSHIFEPFFTTKEKGKGTGLGLANVYGIVKQSGGAVTCTSEVEKGTRFIIRLPLAEQEQAATGPPTDIQEGIGGTESILLVEDDEDVRTITKMILEEAGYSVQVAVNGEEALKIWQEKRGEIDLVLSDLVMPVMRGPEMARRIRQFDARTKFIFMSGWSDQARSDPQLTGEGDSFLQKPLTPEILLATVRAMLDRRPRGKEL